ncbi:MAG: flippase, partial [Methanobacterium sp.]|nr:flippase [Methanobacterium sp.]
MKLRYIVSIMELMSRIVKNSSVFFTAQIISYLFIFLYNIYAARYLGPDNFGILTFGISLIGIFGIFTDLGLNTLMTREIARDRSKSQRYLSNFQTIKCFLLILLFIFTFILIELQVFSGVTVYVILLLMISLVFTTLTSTFYSLFQAYEKLEYQSLTVLLGSIVTLLGVLWAIYYQLDVVAFAFIYLFAGFVNLILVIVVAQRNYVLPKISLDREFWKRNIKIALGFGLIGIFTTIYLWIDSSMLFFIQGTEATGLYGASYKFVYALLFIPIAINLAIFPVMSRFYSTAQDFLMIITEKYFKYMLIVAVPMGVLVTILAPQIILILYGVEYFNSILILQILIWGTVFTFLNAAFVQFFQSDNKELIVTKITGIWMVLNILLNLILIPKYSYIGASINTLITELGVALFLMVAYNRTEYMFEKRKFIPLLGKIL